MIKRFTYKELTLLLGILVALIVIFTLWIRQPANAISRTSKVPGFSRLYSIKKNILKRYVIVFDALHLNQNSPY